MSLTEEQFNRLSSLVYQECGINLHDGKQQLLQARLAKRLRCTGIGTVNQYIETIQNDMEERTHFLDAVSTKHTYFFRESHHFECLQKENADIWCAACSSGEEPYSIAIHCLENGFSPRILATDISISALGIGQRGVFSLERVKNAPINLLKKYFQKGIGKWDGYIRVKDQVKRMVTFQRFNLLRDPLPPKEFDVIFCRNVLIYFDNMVKEKVINKLHGVLKWNGYFIIGGSESLNSLHHSYKYIKPSIYKKA